MQLKTARARAARLATSSSPPFARRTSWSQSCRCASSAICHQTNGASPPSTVPIERSPHESREAGRSVETRFGQAFPSQPAVALAAKKASAVVPPAHQLHWRASTSRSASRPCEVCRSIAGQRGEVYSTAGEKWHRLPKCNMQCKPPGTGEVACSSNRGSASLGNLPRRGRSTMQHSVAPMTPECTLVGATIC